MRRRIMEYGPSVRTARNKGMEQVSQTRVSTRDGVILRSGPGLAQNATFKSKLAPRSVRGIEPPGYQPRNYPSPEF